MGSKTKLRVYIESKLYLLRILKMYNFIFSKVAAQFQSMEVRNSNFAAFIDVFTSNTYVMVVMSDPNIREYLSKQLCTLKYSFLSVE